ncbi:MAG TPA: hypothetical protein VH397_11520 [Xanthobacteraceae bacterium]
MLTTRHAFAVALTIAAAGGGYAALRAAQAPQRAHDRPAWTEIAWPFASDQWGRGRAFRCKAAACGSEIDLYLRAKIGFCNCASAIDDEEVDRVADFDLIGGEHAALDAGRPIGVHGMDGRSRRYALGGNGTKGRSVLAIAFHDRCDMVVATAVVAGDEPAGHENAVVEFLNSEEVRRWAEVTLGL